MLMCDRARPAAAYPLSSRFPEQASSEGGGCRGAREFGRGGPPAGEPGRTPEPGGEDRRALGAARPRHCAALPRRSRVRARLVPAAVDEAVRDDRRRRAGRRRAFFFAEVAVQRHLLAGGRRVRPPQPHDRQRAPPRDAPGPARRRVPHHAGHRAPARDREGPHDGRGGAHHLLDRADGDRRSVDRNAEACSGCHAAGEPLHRVDLRERSRVYRPRARTASSGSSRRSTTRRPARRRPATRTRRAEGARGPRRRRVARPPRPGRPAGFRWRTLAAAAAAAASSGRSRGSSRATT